MTTALDVMPRSSVPTRTATVSIVVPAFNEAASVGAILDGLLALAERDPRICEIIVVDDGSRDQTADVLARLPVTVIRHPSNTGYGSSLKTGVRHARGDYVLTVDADGQHRIEDVERVLDACGTDDMVVGARGADSAAPTWRRPGKRLLKATAEYLAGRRIQDLNSGLRAFRTEVARRYLGILPNAFSFTTTITLAMFKEGFLVRYVPIQVRPRTGGPSTVSTRDGLSALLTCLRVIMLFGPLRIFAPVAGVLGAAALLSSGYDLATAYNLSDSDLLLAISALLVFLFGLLADQVSHLRRQVG